ncbi:hypothetical protein BB560_001087 [Smittium megazygosporum]|uniref:Myosin motor domain-containing protein n=1 Tax=Smittium megazygosporum TaxID=133381 RepID=A0A2T9ZIH3_9FUNG|nr:hypothetical protein BB560_001087 [Smittium megazygosporum]
MPETKAEQSIPVEKCSNSGDGFDITNLEVELEKYKKGVSVFIQSEKEGYISAKLNWLKLNTKKDAVKISFTTDLNKTKEIKIQISELISGEKTLPTILNENGSISDLANIDFPTEPKVLDTLNQRFKSNNYYTYVGPVLIYLNPFNSYNFYTSARTTQLYDLNNKNNVLVPHINSFGNKVYTKAIKKFKDQTVMFLGSSGSGKSSNFKHLIQYLVFLNSMKIENPIEATIADLLENINTIINVFTTENTSQNNNSSRSLQFVQIDYNKDGLIRDISFDIIMMESSVPIISKTKLSSIPIFDALIEFDSAQGGSKWKLGNFSESNRNEENSTKSTKAQDDNKYNKIIGKLEKALAFIGVDEQEKTEIYNILASLLHLSALAFTKEKEDTGNTLTANANFEVFVALLQLEKSEFEKLFLKKVVPIGPEKITSNTGGKEIKSKAEVVSTYIYSKLLKWINEKINSKASSLIKFCRPKKYNEQRSNAIKISVLDACGYEIKSNNGLDQFCVNYVNEKFYSTYIQTHFFHNNDTVDSSKVLSYVQEIKRFGECIADIEGKNGLIQIIENSCLTGPLNSFDLTERIEKNKFFRTIKVKENPENKKKIAFSGFYKQKTKKSEFIVKHYFGETHYNADGFVENNQGVSNTVVKLLSTSGLGTLTKILAGDIEEASRKPLKETEFPKKIEEVSFNLSDRNTKLETKKHLGQLQPTLDDILDKIEKSEFNYVLCLSPNTNKKSIEINNKTVLSQIKSLKIVELSHLHNSVFENQMEKFSFIQKYNFLIDYFCETNNEDDVINKIMDIANVDFYYYKINKTVILFGTHAKRLLESAIKAKINLDSKKVVKRSKRIVRRTDLMYNEDDVLKLQKMVRLALEMKQDTKKQKEMAAIKIQSLARGFQSKKKIYTLDKGSESDFTNIYQNFMQVQIKRPDLEQKLEFYKRMKTTSIKRTCFYKMRLNCLKAMSNKASQVNPNSEALFDKTGISLISIFSKKIASLENKLEYETERGKLNQTNNSRESIRNSIVSVPESVLKKIENVQSMVTNSLFDHNVRITESCNKLELEAKTLQQENVFLFEMLVQLQQHVSMLMFKADASKKSAAEIEDRQNKKINEVLRKVDYLGSLVEYGEDQVNKDKYKIAAMETVSASSSEVGEDDFLAEIFEVKDTESDKDISIHNKYKPSNEIKVSEPLETHRNSTKDGIKEDPINQIIKKPTKLIVKENNKLTSPSSASKVNEIDDKSTKTKKEVSNTKPKSSYSKMRVQKMAFNLENSNSNSKLSKTSNEKSNDPRKETAEESKPKLNDLTLQEKAPRELNYKEILEGIDDSSIFDNEYKSQNSSVDPRFVMFGESSNGPSSIIGEGNPFDTTKPVNLAISEVKKNLAGVNVDKQYKKDIFIYSKLPGTNVGTLEQADCIEEVLLSKKIIDEVSTLLSNVLLPSIKNEKSSRLLTIPSNLTGLVVVKMMNYGLASRIVLLVENSIKKIAQSLQDEKNLGNVLFWVKNIQELSGIIKYGFKVNQINFKNYGEMKDSRSISLENIKKLYLQVYEKATENVIKKISEKKLFGLNPLSKTQIGSRQGSFKATFDESGRGFLQKMFKMTDFLNELLIIVNNFRLNVDFIERLFRQILEHISHEVLNKIADNKILCTTPVCREITTFVSKIDSWTRENNIPKAEKGLRPIIQALDFIEYISSEFTIKELSTKNVMKKYTAIPNAALERIIENVSNNQSHLNSDVNELLVFIQSKNSETALIETTSEKSTNSYEPNERFPFQIRSVKELTISMPNYLDLKILKFIATSEINQTDEHDTETDFEYGFN